MNGLTLIATLFKLQIRLRCVPSLMFTNKKGATQEACTWRWPDKMWQSALVGHALWHLMIWAHDTTPTVTQGSTPHSRWRWRSSSPSALGKGGSPHGLWTGTRWVPFHQWVCNCDNFTVRDQSSFLVVAVSNFVHVLVNKTTFWFPLWYK